MTWQPIESIPKNDRQYLVCRRIADPPYVSMSVAAWMRPEGKWLANMTWFDEEAFRRVWTHWDELPEPPKGN